MEVGKIENMEPKNVFKYFKEISEIPHGSGNLEKISDYLVNIAKSKNLKYIQDQYKNVIIIKEATKGYSKVPAIILQGHMDMVAVKTADCDKNLETEGLELCVLEDDLYAKNTSLGGDDGIALAYALALLTDDTISHPKLEVIFTVDEEVGMDGAREIDLSMLTGKRLINLDSEEEGFLLAGCAGGGTLTGEFPIKRENKKGQISEITIADLFGGHSGVEIDKERGNAIYILARLLRMIKKEVHISMVDIYGGEKDNAIPNRATAKVLLEDEEYSIFEKIVNQNIIIIKKEYQVKEPNIKISLTKKSIENVEVMTNDTSDNFLRFMLCMPDGVQAMSASIKGLVETSLNMGILKAAETKIQFVISVRSSITSAKKELIEKISELIKIHEGSSKLEGEYPAWEYQEHSELREQMCSLYKDTYGKEMKVLIIHAGLECGLLSEKIQGLDCVSIGPDMQDIHTPNEKLSISSTKRVWEFLLKFIQKK